MDNLELAHHLANVADVTAMAAFGSSTVSWKSDGSPVTDADEAIQRRIAETLSSLRPHHGLVGEELLSWDADSLQCVITGLSPNWVVDPIDHTRHFIRDNPEFATLLALFEGGRAMIAMVSAPAMRHRWWAVRGHGAWRDGEAIRVSRIEMLAEAYVAVAGHGEWLARKQSAAVNAILDSCSYGAGTPGGFYDLMKVAEGRLDVFMEPWGKLWDHAAPALIIEEAGGIATTLEGDEPIGGSMLAANPALHPQVMALLCTGA